MSAEIGILTFHRSFSYGAHLQAWALQTLLDELNFKTEFIDYDHPELYKPALRKKHSVHLRSMFSSFEDQHLRIARNTFSKNKVSLQPLFYDAIITGSDQIWNHKIAGNHLPAYLLNFAPPQTKRIAYAASFGRSEINFSTKVRTKFENELPQFHAIGVREKSMLKTCSKLGGSNPVAVLDPTLAIKSDSFEKLITSPLPFSVRKYALGFFLSRRKKKWNALKKIARFYSKPAVRIHKKFCLLSNLRNIFCCPDISLFLQLIKNCSIFVTDSYHGMILAIIFKKPFALLLEKDNPQNVRLMDLAKLLNLTQQIIFDWSSKSLSNQLSSICKIDFSRIDKILASRRQASINFIKNALS